MAILDRILKKIRDELASNDVTIEADTPIAKSLDSTALIELVVWCQDTFSIDVDIGDEGTHFTTPRKVAEYIEKKGGKAVS